MGVYTRPDSKYFWMAIEQPDGTLADRQSTKIPCKGLTPDQYKTNRTLANQLYLKRATTISAEGHGLMPKARARITFAAYADWYETNVIGDDERELDILQHLRRGFHAAHVDEIDRPATTEYMTRRRTAGASANTVNREVDLLKAMIRDAAPKYIAASPLVGMKRLKVIPPRRHYMTEAEEDQIVRVLEAERDDVGLALLYLGVDSLIRLGDLLDFQRADDRKRSGWIQAPKDPRQPEPYTFPISRRARRALDRIPDDGPYYFARFRVAKKERDWRGAVRQWLERVCVTAGVRYGRRTGGVTWHWATRRTGASRMIRRKVDLGTVQDVGHWKDPEVVLEIYRESFSEEAARAVEVPGRRARRFTSRSRRQKTRGNIKESAS